MKKVIFSMCMTLVTLSSYAYMVGDNSEIVGNAGEYEKQGMFTHEQTGAMKPNFYCWKNKTLNSGNMKNAEIGILSGIDGKIYSTCEFAENEEIRRKCHLGVAPVGGGLAFVSMLNNKYLKCNGVGLQGGLLMRFRKLSATNPEEKFFLDKVKNGTLKDLESTNQLMELCKKTVTAARYVAGNDEYNTTNEQGMEIGGVNMVVVYKGDKVHINNIVQVGFIELIDAVTTSPPMGSLTVNFYLKDLLSK